MTHSVNNFSDLGAWTGLLGGAVALVSAWFQYRDRKAQLTSLALNIPNSFQIEVIEGSTMRHAIFSCVKISNLGTRPCVIYWEHSRAKVYSDNAWHDVKIIHFNSARQHIYNNLPDDRRDLIGIGHVKYHTLHDSPPVREDQPFIRIMGFIHEDRQVIENTEKIRICIIDSQQKRRTLDYTLPDRKTLGGQS